MKRIVVFAVLLTFVLAGAAFVYGAERHDTTRLTIDPGEMKDGETKTLVDGDKKITVKKSGDSLDVKIEGAGKTRTITISNGGGAVSIFRDGTAFQTLPALPGMPRILIDRHEQHPTQTWFVCPKDHTMLRVPDGKGDETYKCPVDGTTMEKRKARGFAFSFDHGEHL